MADDTEPNTFSDDIGESVELKDNEAGANDGNDEDTHMAGTGQSADSMEMGMSIGGVGGCGGRGGRGARGERGGTGAIITAMQRESQGKVLDEVGERIKHRFKTFLEVKWQRRRKASKNY